MNSGRAPHLVRIRRVYAKAMRRIVRIGGAVFSPVEHGALAGLKSAFKFTEKGHFVEQLFARLISILLWPFRVVGRVFITITRLVIPRSIRAPFSEGYSRLSHLGDRIGDGVMRGAEWLNLDGILIWAARLT